MTGETLDVKDMCSPVTYQVAPPLGNILTLSGDTLTLVASDKSEAFAPLNYEIQASLENHPSVTVTSQFTAEVVDLCLATSLSFDTDLTDLDYQVGAQAIT